MDVNQIGLKSGEPLLDQNARSRRINRTESCFRTRGKSINLSVVGFEQLDGMPIPLKQFVLGSDGRVLAAGLLVMIVHQQDAQALLLFSSAAEKLNDWMESYRQ